MGDRDESLLLTRARTGMKKAPGQLAKRQSPWALSPSESQVCLRQSIDSSPGRQNAATPDSAPGGIRTGAARLKRPPL